MAKQEPEVPPAKLALYDKLLSAFPVVQRKGAKSAYTSLNGHMTSFMTEDGRLALRLPADYREALLAKSGMEVCIQYGTVMKEYVLCSHASLQKSAAMKKHFATSLAYIASLKPKPTTRKKAAAKKAVKKKPKKNKATRKSAAKKR